MELQRQFPSALDLKREKTAFFGLSKGEKKWTVSKNNKNGADKFGIYVKL